MQKQIIFVCILCGVYISAMEKKISLPYIGTEDINGKKTSLDSLVIQLSKKYSDISYTALSQEDILSHQSPLIKLIHSQQYLNNIEKHPSIMLSAITNTWLPALYPNYYSRTYFDTMLKQCATTVVATKLLIDQLHQKKTPPHYTISLGEGYSFAGHAEGNNGHPYATIAIAAAYALNTEIIKRILIIDENFNKEETIKDCYEHGNGSIFYSTNTELSKLFNNKIITLKKMLNSYHLPINLAFYNINIENLNETRALSITNLLNQLIPTVFILSGDKNKYKDTAYAIINHIADVTKLVSAFTLYNSPHDSPRKMPTTSTSHISSSSSCSYDSHSDYDTETLSLSSNDYNEKLIFKITTNKEDTLTHDGANFIYLAKDITINNGVMEIELADDYSMLGGYCHSPTSSSNNSGYATDSENDQYNEYCEENDPIITGKEI